MGPTGVLLFPKPAGVTSHDVVAGVRRGLREAHGKVKVGHAGTLDPFATGLLLVLVGQATRAQRFLMGLPKTYRTVARLGWVSDTGDRDGVLTQTGRIPADPVIPVGEQLQRPPAYSAVKVDGERLYERARRGDPVEGEARPVTVYRADRLALDGETAEFEIECSAGTYIRQLVAALGDAYCQELERTAIGGFRLEDADPDVLVPLDAALEFIPALELEGEQARGMRDGRPFEFEGAEAGDMRLMHEGALMAIGRAQDGLMKPVVVFTA
ncbi:MAG: tRNA pseudouridine55 synthase [Thermoleophilaceae bacterium]|jgi:tRNA pseudouridine55 synthase|nr:tRNA pseudouridine55 synthase [Thermoleophilaceae bacterium]